MSDTITMPGDPKRGEASYPTDTRRPDRLIKREILILIIDRHAGNGVICPHAIGYPRSGRRYSRTSAGRPCDAGTPT
jgi:hypothetical protein